MRLSNIESSESNYLKAIEYIKNSTHIYSQLYEDDYYELVINYNLIGSFYTYIHNYDSATIYLERSLTLARKIFGENNIYSPGSLNLLARIAYNRGDLKEAKKLLLESYNQVKNTYLGPHATKTTALSNLSIFYSGLGLSDSSRLFIDQAINMADELYGPNSYRVAYLKQTAASNNITLGNRIQAAEYYEQAIKIYDSLFSKLTPEIIRCKLDYAMNFVELDQKNTALDLINSVKSNYISQKPIDSLNLADINSMLSQTLFRMNRLSEAQDLLLDNIELLQRTKGGDRMLNYNQKLLNKVEADLKK